MIYEEFLTLKGKGYKGHEPEYRGCVISKSSQILNIQVESSILGK